MRGWLGARGQFDAGDDNYFEDEEGIKMSWSVAAIGKAEAVRAEVARQFSVNPCAEPEESVRQAAAKVIDAALAAQDSGHAVKVDASGSQGFKDWNAKSGVYNALRISIEPQHGFIE